MPVVCRSALSKVICISFTFNKISVAVFAIMKFRSQNSHLVWTKEGRESCVLSLFFLSFLPAEDLPNLYQVETLARELVKSFSHLSQY